MKFDEDQKLVSEIYKSLGVNSTVDRSYPLSFGVDKKGNKIPKCESCNIASWKVMPVPSLTRYPLDKGVQVQSEGDPNRNPWLCEKCKDEYQDYWSDMWSDFYSNFGHDKK